MNSPTPRSSWLSSASAAAQQLDMTDFGLALLAAAAMIVIDRMARLITTVGSHGHGCMRRS
jgi:hypothetical protein